ncbi:Acyltransferase family [Teratosphaeria destructans]|uniref:Acyltransferase family n=1 Tax=Teratosphaeria destructans TaxID=418781 RepID=A0A9W7SNK0_9PEZI|nr:Acyltransferase family [Teratosphaeria destructans]
MLSILGRWLHGSSRLFFGLPHPKDVSKETAWLDGVRGLAAFLVVMNHYNLEWMSAIADAPFGSVVLNTVNPDGVWHYQKGDRVWEIWRLPIIRIFVSSGNAQVAVFLVLSGFVLSWSPLVALRTGQIEKLAQSLGSSVIRRWFRLYLPCFAVSYLYFLRKLVVEYGGVEWMFKEFWKFITVMESWSNPFETLKVLSLAANNPYDYVMWTIPFEFGGSIFVYTLLLAMGRIRSYKRRTLAMLFVTLYAFFKAYWCQWLFGTGTILADYVRHRGGFEQLSQGTSRRASRLWFIALLIGLLLMGLPTKNADFEAFGYEWLRSADWPSSYTQVAPGRQWWGIGGILFITSCCHLRAAQKFFELWPIQYLGRISFMLYLDHILINEMVSLPLRTVLYHAFCAKETSEIWAGHVYRSTPIKNITFYCITWIASVPIAVSMAHLLEIWIDRPCTSFGKSLDERLVNGSRYVRLRGDVEEAVSNSDFSGHPNAVRSDGIERSEPEEHVQKLS